MKKIVIVTVILVLSACVGWAQDTIYQCDFDHSGDTSGWLFARGESSHYWVLGRATNNMRSAGLFVTPDGIDNYYYIYDPSSISYVYRRMVLPRGAYRFSYDWRCNGRRDGDYAYDYMRVFLVPGRMTPVGSQVPAGMGVVSDISLPAGYIALDGNTPQCGSPDWVSHSSDCFVEDSGVYTLVFMWYSTIGQWDPPAAVDNLLVTRPVCPQPGRLFVSPLTVTSLTVHWSDFSEGNTANWLVELCTASESFGQGVQQVRQDTTAEFIGLTPNTDYWVYVSALCDSDSTAPVVVHVHTPCVGLDSLPYVQDFDSVAVGTLPPCWRVLRTGGGADVRRVDTNHVLKWRIAQSGYCCMVLPSVAANAVPSEDIQLSFRYSRVPSSLPFAHEIVIGVMSNPSNIGSFEPVSRVVVNSDEWERCVVEFDGYSGDNIAILDMGNVLIDGYVLFDDFVIDRQTACQPVEHLTVGRTSAAGARLEWERLQGTVHEPGGYDVWIETVDTVVPNPSEPDTASLRFGSTEPHCTVTGLQPRTTYRAWVRAQCVGGAHSEWVSVVFATLTLPCAVGDSATADSALLGTGSSRMSGVPVSNVYVHSLCQSIYTADELHAAGLSAGPITGIDYTFTSNPHDMTVSLFVATTSDSLYASTAELIAPTADDRMYGPALYAAGTGGTVHFELERPFWWNGVDNLAVTSFINNASGALQSASFFGNSSQTVGTQTVHCYLNEEPFTTANALTGHAQLSSYRPSLTFHTMGCAVPSTCAPPIITVREVGEDYALVEWLPGYHENVWSVYYRVADDSVWTLADSHAATNHYLLTPLAASTSYEVRVVPHCGGDSIFGKARFATLCGSVYELPLFEGFEDFEASMSDEEIFEACWYRGPSIPSYTNSCFPFVYGGGGNTGTYYLNFSYIAGTRWPVYIATPAMAMDVSELQVSFFINSYYRYQLRIGVMTDPTDYSTFEEVVMLSGEATYGWVQKEVSLDGYSGEGRHIAIMPIENSVMIDDLMIDYIQTCPRPSNLSFGIITRTTAEVQWDGGEAGRYELEYGPAGFALGSGTRLACNADTVTLRGLSHSTDYSVYVRGFCGEDTSRWSFVATFSTQCGEIDSLPYSQTFDDLGGLPYPKCWVCRNASIASRMPTGALRPENALYLNRGYAILPGVDTALGAIHTLQLVVKALSDNNYEEVYSHDLIVGVCSTEGDFTTFNPLDTITLTGVSTYYEVPLTGAAGVGRYITLRSTPTGRALNNNVFIDSLAIEPIPSCSRPRRLTVTDLDTTSATVAWSGGTGATAWQVEYMPHGDSIGSGVRQTSSTNSLVINGLTPATAYDYYVRSICGEGDTSEWCHAPGLIVTQQVPASVPYSYGFDTVTEWNSWQTLTNCAATWCRGVADGLPAPSMYLSIDSGATRGISSRTVINAAVYRDFDFGDRDTSYVISFSASEEGMGNESHDGLAVFVVDPREVPNMPSSNANESPWGSLGNLTLLANIHSPRNWSEYQFTVDSLRGVWRLVFYWYGRAGVYPAPAAVDNVSIQYVTCQHPYGVHATEVTAVTGTLRWHGPEDADYQVTLYNADRMPLTVDTVHGASIHYEDLVPSSIYKVRVGRLCDGSLGRQTPLYTFATNACAGGSNDTILGTATTGTTYCLPVHNCYRYSYTQQIVLASELGGAGDISSISFLYESPLRMTAKSNCTIYLGHTEQTCFDHPNDTVSRSAMQVVYMGSINCSQGWNRILLGTPFAYDGASNLVLAIDDNSGDYHGYRYQFATSATTHAMSLAHFTSFSDDAASRQLYNYRNVLSIEMCPPNECPRPRLRTPRVRTADVTLRWRNTSDRYLVGYRLMGSDSWIVDDLFTTDTFYTITSFYFDSDYVYHVSQYCDSGVSNWSIGTFNTAEIPCLPPLDLRVTHKTNTQAWFAWTPEGNNISYRLHVWGGGGYDTIVTTYLASGTVEGLYPASRYYAAVEVRCEYLDEPSVWSDTISFQTAACPDATDLVAREVHGNSLLLDWQCDESVGRWQVEWGLQGFDQGTGTTVIADHHPFLLTGLTGETSYDIDVRSLCDDGYVSESWSNRITVTTAYSGIDGASDDLRVRLTPNPTSGDMVLTLPAGMGAVRVEVIDMAGRTLQTYILPAHTARTTLAISQLPQGAYYVRVSSDTFSTVVKALKK